MSLWEHQNLDAEIIAVAVTQMFRIKRVGETYFIEHQQFPNDWRVVAKSVPDKDAPSGRRAAFKWMHDAQRELIQHVHMQQEQDRQRSEVPNGSRARGAGDGHV